MTSMGSVLVGAGEEVRTLDIYLGKVMLYQLSYARIRILVKDSQSFGFSTELLATQIFQICSFGLA